MKSKKKKKNLRVSAGFIHVERYRYISLYLYNAPKRIREPLLARGTEHMRAHYFSIFIITTENFFFFFLNAHTGGIQAHFASNIIFHFYCLFFMSLKIFFYISLLLFSEGYISLLDLKNKSN